MFRYIHFLQLPTNHHGRDFILADLHGCYSELLEAMSIVDFDPSKDRILSVGDLIDRGEESLACLRLLKEPWFFSVQGNHENMMLGGLKAGPGSDPWRGWMQNGGQWYSLLNRKQLKLIKDLLPLIKGMPITAILPTRTGKKIGLSHAQPPIFDWSKLNEGYRLSGDEIWRAMWSREIVRKNTKTQVQGVDLTFHGHTIVRRPKRISNMHFIDTGSYVNKKVRLIELTDEFVMKREKVV